MLAKYQEGICYLPFLGIKSPFFSFSYSCFYDVLYIHIIMIIFLWMLFYFLKKHSIKKEKLNKYNFVYASYIYFANILFYFIKDAIHFCDKQLFSFVGSFFSVLLFYNCASIFPHVEETTKDLNVCLAFALYGFLYVQYIAISHLKKNYIYHWVKVVMNPGSSDGSFYYYIFLLASILVNSVATVVLFPFALLEQFSMLFSLTFRLFGNIFGGSIVCELLYKLQHAGLIYHLATTVFGLQLLVLLYFSFFEGIIQAFIFTLILVNNIGSYIEKND